MSVGSQKSATSDGITLVGISTTAAPFILKTNDSSAIPPYDRTYNNIIMIFLSSTYELLN